MYIDIIVSGDSRWHNSQKFIDTTTNIIFFSESETWIQPTLINFRPTILEDSWNKIIKRLEFQESILSLN